MASGSISQPRSGEPRAGEPPAGAPTSAPPVPVDLSTTCLQCGAAMREEHAHYRCPACGWRDSCCDGPY